jgi:hypothetical protein
MENQYEFEKYACTKETMGHMIREYGIAIIPNVLNDTECNNMVSGIWDFLEHITEEWEVPLNRENRETWREFYKLYPLHSMLLQSFGVGHAQVSWDVRQNRKIVEIFAHFWNCLPEDLLVSFDGLSFNLPPEVTNKGWFRNNLWYHTDQSYLKTEFKCIQSWITGLDVNEKDATLTIMEGSNKYHGEFKERFNVNNKADWYKLSKIEEHFYVQKGCNYKNIKCPKGSLVLWDSRTIHCGIEATRGRPQPNIRAIIYLCYMPRELCNAKNLRKKQNAFEELRTTSHYPCDIKLFPKEPRTYGGEVPKTKPNIQPKLNALGIKLAGF